MIAALLVYVIAERLIELVIARRNTQRLLAQGGVEVGAGHYPFIVAIHVAWLGAIVAWAVIKDPAPNAFFFAVYVALQFFRFWVMASLGRYWTTRIITVPDARLVQRGPYRFLKHPNYVVVALEIVVLPLVVGGVAISVVFSVANALAMLVRIKAENAALSSRSMS